MSGIWVFLVYAAVLCSSSIAFKPVRAASCPNVQSLFLYDLRSQCSYSIPPNPPLKVDGNFLDRALSSKQRNSYTSVLFHASWCPFSYNVHRQFEMLSSMFPQIEHFTVDRSAAMPSVFSRYGIHSLPSMLVVNQTSRVWYHGEKDLRSLTQFYRKLTGFEPIQYFSEGSLGTSEYKNCILQRVYLSSLEDAMTREPYLVFATLFVLLRVILFLSPLLVSRVKALYGSFIPQFNLEIFGGARQLFERVLHMVDVRRIWTRMRLCKTRNFHERAKSCQVWASSFASVSLGESRYES